MESTRQLRVARHLQKEVGDIFQFEVARHFPGTMITVTKVHVTRDLSIARVYLSLFATKDKKQLIENIRHHTSEIRYKLGNRIRNQVKNIPALEFFEDDSLDYIENIDKLLDE